MTEDRKHSETKVVVCYNCKGEGVYYSQHLTDYHRGEYDTKQHICHICEGSGLLSEIVVVKYEPYTQPHSQRSGQMMNKGNRMREPFRTLIWKASVGYNDSWSRVDPEVLEKFGEMIVKRCASIYDAIDNGNTQEGTDDYFEALKRHFGLEE